MNPPFWHLTLNHLPVEGMFVGTLLLLVSVWRRNEVLMRASLLVLVVVAITSVPVYLTGLKAEDTLMAQPEFMDQLSDSHHHAATFALVATLLTGVLAIAALIFFQKFRRLTCGVLALSIASSILLGWTAHRGGLIQHPEIRPPDRADTHH